MSTIKLQYKKNGFLITGGTNLYGFGRRHSFDMLHIMYCLKYHRKSTIRAHAASGCRTNVLCLHHCRSRVQTELCVEIQRHKLPMGRPCMHMLLVGPS